jgi:hypothetical protein
LTLACSSVGADMVKGWMEKKNKSIDYSRGDETE